MRLTRLGWILGLAAAAWLCALSPQPGPLRASESDPADTSGVYVPESGEALSRIRQVHRLAQAGMWDQAAQLIQEVQTHYAGKLIRKADGLYVSVSDHVTGELSTWPAQGLEVYRRRYDSLARRAYEQASERRDLTAMAAVARDYWLNTVGGQAADEAAEMALEAGRFSTAIDLWRRLADRPALTDAERSARTLVLAKLAVVLAWDDQAAKAAEVRKRLAASLASPDFPSPFSEGTLLAWVDANSKPLGASAAPVGTAGNYPLLGGSNLRTTVPQIDLVLGAEIWSFDEFAEKKAARPDPRRGAVQAQLDPMVLPIVVDGVIYLSSPRGAYAVSGNSGARLWHNGTSTHGSDPRAPVYYGGQMRLSRLFSPTYSDGRVYAEFGTAYSSGGVFWRGGGPSLPGGVVCLDAVNGKELWKLDVSELPGLQSPRVDSSPLVMGGRVFLVVRQQRGGVFDNCVLVAADARSGEVLWQRQLTETSTAGRYYYRGVTPSQATLAAGEGNTVYLVTNLGTVAAVSADSGIIRWLRVYRREEQTANQARVMNAMPVNQVKQLGSDYAPTLLWNDRVVGLPYDGLDLLVLDALTGELIHSVSRKQLHDAGELFGILDNKLYCRGGQYVVCWDLAAHRKAWEQNLGDEPSYRGFLTRGYLYIPLAKALMRLDLSAKGSIERFHWPDNAEGSILLTGQQIITVSGSRMAGFSEWETAQKRCLADIAAAPGRPDPILTYAQIAYATNHMDIATGQLEQAVEAAGGFATLTDARIKRQVFTYALDFARSSWMADPQRTLKLLTMASLCPPDVEAHIRYRMALADYWEARADPGQAVRYYQEVLCDPEMRAGDYQPPKADGKTEAGRFARSAIDRLIKVQGRESYAAVAAQADQLYDQAIARKDYDEIGQLVYQYPNAERTRAMIVLLAAHQAELAEYESAIDRLRYLEREYSDVLNDRPDEDVQALTLLASYSLALSDQWAARQDIGERERRSRSLRALRGAYGFLKQGKRRPEATIALRGVEATFAEHRARLEASCPQLLQLLPQVSAELSRHVDVSINGAGRLLGPLVGDPPSASDETLLVLATVPGRMDLQAFRPSRDGGRKPVWSKRFKQGNMAPSLVACVDDRAIVAEGAELTALDFDDGSTAWTCKTRAEANSGLRFFAMHENLLFAGSMEGAALLVDLEGGRPLLNLSLPNRINSQVFMNQGVICYVSRFRGPAQLVVLDTRTGKPLGEFDEVARQMPAMIWCAADQDGRVILAGDGQRIISIDAATGKVLKQLNRTGHTFNPSLGVIVRGDSMFLSDIASGEVHLVRCDLADISRPKWDRVVPPVNRGQGVTGVVRLAEHEDEIYLWANNFLAAVDAETGKLSWSGSIPPDVNLREIMLSENYVIALGLQTARNPRRGVAVRPSLDVGFYDRTPGHGSRVLGLSLGSVTYYSQRAMAPANPGLAVQFENSKIRVFLPATEPPARPGPAKR